MMNNDEQNWEETINWERFDPPAGGRAFFDNMKASIPQLDKSIAQLRTQYETESGRIARQAEVMKIAERLQKEFDAISESEAFRRVLNFMDTRVKLIFPRGEIPTIGEWLRWGGHITRALLAEPAITDICGMLVDGRQSGWPILPEQHEKRPFYANMMKILPYFDTVHFAPRVKVPVRCYVGFVDILCPPHAVWAGYNCLGSVDKKMVNVPGLDHGRPRDLWYGAWKRCDQSW